jgi:hypothetical protein
MGIASVFGERETLGRSEECNYTFRYPLCMGTSTAGALGRASHGLFRNMQTLHLRCTPFDILPLPTRNASTNIALCFSVKSAGVFFRVPQL